MSDQLTIKPVTANELDKLADMFNEYRQFYKQPSDVSAGREFLKQRLEQNQSKAFIAELGDQPVGFIHLYPGFSSVHLKPIWTMNDLYVRSIARRKGVGFALLDAAKQMALDTGAIVIQLSTLQRNIAAQQVYESKGYRRDKTFYHYNLPLKP